MKINDGGPAFPADGEAPGVQSYNRRPTPPTTGMSLRDWFAGQALASLPHRLADGAYPEALAEQAYGIADAMLAKKGK